MKTITIGFSKHKGFAPGSSLIRWYTKRPFSHTYFRFKDETYTDDTIFHAVGKGLIYISSTNFLRDNEVVQEFSLKVNEEMFKIILNVCHQKAGKKYGYKQNLGILLVRQLNKLGFALDKNPLDDGINCSELMFYLLSEVHGQWSKKDPNLITPADIYDFLVSKYGTNTQNN